MSIEQRYDQAVAAIRQSREDGYRLTGSLRVHWPDVQAALDARLVTTADLARAINANPVTIRTLVKRLRNETQRKPTATPSPAATSDTNTSAPSDQNESPTTEDQAKQEPEDDPAEAIKKQSQAQKDKDQTQKETQKARDRGMPFD